VLGNHKTDKKGYAGTSFPQHRLYFFPLPQKVKLKFETLAIHESDGVAYIELNRPDKGNAMNGAMWKDMRSAFDWLSGSCARVGVLSGRGKHFTAGMDLELPAAVKSEITSLPEGW
jgi:enoyl-CoA hydratase